MGLATQRNRKRKAFAKKSKILSVPRVIGIVNTGTGGNTKRAPNQASREYGEARVNIVQGPITRKYSAETAWTGAMRQTPYITGPLSRLHQKSVPAY